VEEAAVVVVEALRVITKSESCRCCDRLSGTYSNLLCSVRQQESVLEYAIVTQNDRVLKVRAWK